MAGESQAVVGFESLQGGEGQARQPEVLVVDYGAQLVDVIYWGIVESGRRAHIAHHDVFEEVGVDTIKADYRAVIGAGGGDSVNTEDAPEFPADLAEGQPPLFGICYAAQAITKALGGEVGRAHIGEYGEKTITIDPNAVIYQGLQETTKVLMSHGDSILRLPAGFQQTGESQGIVASAENADGTVVITQFHPEATETEHGLAMIDRFLSEVAGIEPDPEYTLDVAVNEYAEREEGKIAAMLESGAQIRGFLSGGVDSMVSAKMIVKVAAEHERLDQVKFYYVNSGHNRTEDDTVVEEMIAEGMPVETVEAVNRYFHTQVEVEDEQGDRFLSPELVDEWRPEIKRQIIGGVFNMIAREKIQEATDEFGGMVYFMQGTNASDIIESRRKIKGHHNITPMDDLREQGHLLEPLSGLMKYHVRLLAEERYGLSHHFATRQPFPGVGFSPRILVNLTGELPPVDQDEQKRLDALVEEASDGLLRGHLVNLSTVGQQGDERSLVGAVLLDGRQDWDVLNHVSGIVTDQFRGVANRVFSVPFEPISRSKLSAVVVRDDEDHAAKLKIMEEIHRASFVDLDIDPYVSQHFVGSLWLDLDGARLPTLALRAVVSGKDLDKKALRRNSVSRETLRTARAVMPGVHIEHSPFSRHLAQLSNEIMGHGRLVYDITGKPPATIEWE